MDIFTQKKNFLNWKNGMISFFHLNMAWEFKNFIHRVYFLHSCLFLI